ncbi:hypothetical protein C8R46DRAFT_1362284 [Mycena filopes]|nr:hypothetical protein C8R46DRAFT_1362284 [Mycena filopes]
MPLDLALLGGIVLVFLHLSPNYLRRRLPPQRPSRAHILPHTRRWRSSGAGRQEGASALSRSASISAALGGRSLVVRAVLDEDISGVLSLPLDLGQALQSGGARDILGEQWYIQEEMTLTHFHKMQYTIPPRRTLDRPLTILMRPTPIAYLHAGGGTRGILDEACFMDPIVEYSDGVHWQTHHAALQLELLPFMYAHILLRTRR